MLLGKLKLYPETLCENCETEFRDQEYVDLVLLLDSNEMYVEHARCYSEKSASREHLRGTYEVEHCIN